MDVPSLRIWMFPDIELSTNVLDLVAGQTEGLSFRIAPEDTANKNVIWSSSNDQVATVSEDGFVTAVEAGTAKITETTEVKGLSASCNVTVIRVYGKDKYDLHFIKHCE